MYMSDMAFALYVAEQEGWLDTHESKVNRFLKELATAVNPADSEEQIEILYRCGLTPDALTDYDHVRIQEEVERLL